LRVFEKSSIPLRYEGEAPAVDAAGGGRRKPR
jgi:hypothetical protein